jgi:hypothetical protein
MQQNQFVDLYRNGIRTATDFARMSLEASVRMQEKQLEIVRGIVEEQSRSAEEITRAGSVEELLALQSRLAGAQMGRVVEFWSRVWQTAAQNQAQGLREIQNFASRSSEDVARAAASQVSRAAGSVAESADAANHERKAQQRKSA